MGGIILSIYYYTREGKKNKTPGGLQYHDGRTVIKSIVFSAIFILKKKRFLKAFCKKLLEKRLIYGDIKLVLITALKYKQVD